MPDVNAYYDAAKTQLFHEPGIISVTRSSGNIIFLGNQTDGNGWDGKLPHQTFIVYPVSIDKDFIPFFNLQLVAGNNFTGTITDSSYVILNETTIREAGITNLIGKRFKLFNHQATIIGVVKDFHFASLKNKIELAVLYYEPSFSNVLHIKTTAKDAAKAIAAAKSVWSQYQGGFPFNYTFMEEDFGNLYKTEQHTGTLFNVFATIAIFISCLGLLGIAAYTAQVHTREIGVRKVLGASVSGIVQLLAVNFIKLVFISIIIATPLAWYVMNNWLNDFAYKIGISWKVLAVSELIAILIAIITISFQSIKAALSNPVENLRTE